MTANPDRAKIPVVVDEDLSEDKLRFLLDLAEERRELDYKSSFDSSSTEDKVKLAKDAIAMANTSGGYLILGASNDGTPVGLPKEQYDGLDGSKLANKTNAYCRPAKVSLTLHKHEISVEGGVALLVLVLARKSERPPILMTRDGTYPGPTGKQQVCEFRAGDVYVRHDDQSVRMTPADMQRFISEAIERQKESWMGDVTELVAKSADIFDVSTAMRQELGPAALMINPSAFWETLVSLLRGQDTVGVSHLVDVATGYAAGKWEEAKGQPPDMPDARSRAEEILKRHCAVALDKLMLIAAVAIRFRQKDILRECLSAFAKLYRTPASDEVFRRFPRSDGTAFLLWTWFWRAVMTRVYAFGGYAVLRESFQSVRIIARTGVQPVTAGTPRQPLISDPDWDYRSRGHLQYFEEAGHYLERKAAVLKLLPEEATQALDYVCRFDLLVDYSLHLERIPNPFPNFAIHYPQRTMPIIEQIITEPSQVWGTDFDGVEFARFLDTIPQRMVGMKFAPRWRAYISKLVRGFPDENR